MLHPSLGQQAEQALVQLHAEALQAELAPVCPAVYRLCLLPCSEVHASARLDGCAKAGRLNLPAESCACSLDAKRGLCLADSQLCEQQKR